MAKWVSHSLFVLAIKSPIIFLFIFWVDALLLGFMFSILCFLVIAYFNWEYFVSWHGSSMGKDWKKIWRFAPLCIFWFIWKERNMIVFKSFWKVIASCIKVKRLFPSNLGFPGFPGFGFFNGKEFDSLLIRRLGGHCLLCFFFSFIWGLLYTS